MRGVKLVLFVCVSLVVSNLYAGGVGTVGADFLRITVGARPSSMGEAYVAVADDTNALQWNPAGLTQLETTEASATFMSYVAGILSGNIYYVQPSEKGCVGVGVIYMSAHGMDKTEINPAKPDDPIMTGEKFSASNVAFTVSHGKKLKIEDRDVSVGGNIKLVNSGIEYETAVALAADIGILVRTGDKKQQFGFVLQNALSTGMKFKETHNMLPLNAKLGACGKFLEGDALTVAADLNVPTTARSSIALGVEYSLPLELEGMEVAVRGGYNTITELSGLSFGAGVKLENGLGVNYAVSSMGDFGLVHRISVAHRLLLK